MNQCLQRLQHEESSITIGHVAIILALQKIGCQLKVSSLCWIPPISAQYITARMADDDAHAADNCDWQFAAMVVDRLCLYLMTGCTILSVAYILYAAPYLDA